MRRVSKPNSRPWLSLDTRYDYERENTVCEIARLFPEWERGWKRIPGSPPTIVHATETPRTCVHHLAWGHAGNRRWDRVWNLVSIGWHAHLFVHAFPVDGLSICLKAKIEKNEWDAAAARETLGLNLIGYLYGKSCEHDFAEEYRRELIDSLEVA